MKSLNDIEKRLRKLRLRYAHKYIQKTQLRQHKNCKFNAVHKPERLKYSKTPENEMELAPRVQQTLVILHDNDQSIHLCMYNADNETKWLGMTCDSDDIAKSCTWFKPCVSALEAKNEFLELVADDEYVFEHYRDVATLQWVIGERVHSLALTLWERVFLWFSVTFSRITKPIRQLPISEIPKDLWDDSSTNS